MTSENTELSRAIGRTEQRDAPIAPEPVAAFAATLDLDVDLANGLPPGWHWLFFNPIVPRRDIGADGHPKLGGFLPDVGLPRRMWAGGRLRYRAPLQIGQPAIKTSKILDITSKQGRAGALVFITLRHQIVQGDTIAIEEEQDIVYREAPAPDAPSPAPVSPPQGVGTPQMIAPDPVLLFRYSALTFNGHRIHYDRTYAQTVEEYRDLVVHGPLTATLLQRFALTYAQQTHPNTRLIGFDFRGVAPLFVDRPFSLHRGAPDGNSLRIWAQGPDEDLAMTATATFDL